MSIHNHVVWYHPVSKADLISIKQYPRRQVLHSGLLFFSCFMLAWSFWNKQDFSKFQFRSEWLGPWWFPVACGIRRKCGTPAESALLRADRWSCACLRWERPLAEDLVLDIKDSHIMRFYVGASTVNLTSRRANEKLARFLGWKQIVPQYLCSVAFHNLLIAGDNTVYTKHVKPICC